MCHTKMKNQPSSKHFMGPACSNVLAGMVSLLRAEIISSVCLRSVCHYALLFQFPIVMFILKNCSTLSCYKVKLKVQQTNVGQKKESTKICQIEKNLSKLRLVLYNRCEPDTGVIMNIPRCLSLSTVVNRVNAALCQKVEASF